MSSLLLCNELPCVKFHQHGSISFEFLNGHREAEIIEEEELELEVIELS